MKDIATSPPNLPVFAAVSFPAGNRPAAITYDGRKEVYHHIPLPREHGNILATGGIFRRREEGIGKAPRPNGKGSLRRTLSEDKRSMSDLSTASDTEWSIAGPRRRRRRKRSTRVEGAVSNPPHNSASTSKEE